MSVAISIVDSDAQSRPFGGITVDAGHIPIPLKAGNTASVATAKVFLQVNSSNGGAISTTPADWTASGPIYAVVNATTGVLQGLAYAGFTAPAGGVQVTAGTPNLVTLTLTTPDPNQIYVGNYVQLDIRYKNQFLVTAYMVLT